MKLTLLAAGAVLALSACGSSSSSDTAGQAQGAAGSTSQGGGQDRGGAGFGGHFPGASGQIAEVDGKTLQVQSRSAGQVAVTWTGSTTITTDAKATLADVKVGACVTVVPVRSTTGSASAGSGTTGASSGPITAGEVRITAASNGSCDGGFGGGFGGGRGAGSAGSGAVPSGGPSGFPSGGPSGMPSGAPGGFRGQGGGFGGFGANGKVTAVTSHGFTVEARTFDPSNPSASPTTRAVQVSVSRSTTYTTTQQTSASALKVGACVTATGRTDDTGAVTASRIQVSTQVSGTCGFGGFGGFGGSRG